MVKYGMNFSSILLIILIELLLLVNWNILNALQTFIWSSLLIHKTFEHGSDILVSKFFRVVSSLICVYASIGLAEENGRRQQKSLLWQILID
jgi:hypothetical protein